MRPKGCLAASYSIMRPLNLEYKAPGHEREFNNRVALSEGSFRTSITFLMQRIVLELCLKAMSIFSSGFVSCLRYLPVDEEYEAQSDSLNIFPHYNGSISSPQFVV
jgi:hypothetical protein